MQTNSFNELINAEKIAAKMKIKTICVQGGIFCILFAVLFFLPITCFLIQETRRASSTSWPHKTKICSVDPHSSCNFMLNAPGSSQFVVYGWHHLPSGNLKNNCSAFLTIPGTFVIRLSEPKQTDK